VHEYEYDIRHDSQTDLAATPPKNKFPIWKKTDSLKLRLFNPHIALLFLHTSIELQE